MKIPRIARIIATEVVVPSNPGSVESPGLNKPLHKLPSGASKGWTKQFDEFGKIVLRLELSDGTVGLGECYRDHDWNQIEGMAAALLGSDIRTLNRQDLPVARSRAYDGFEVAIWDAFARLHGLRIVDLLGGAVRDRVEVGAWTGQRRDEDVADVARNFAADGFTTLKFKCDLGDDVVGWARTVSEVAPGMKIIFDPNERFERPCEVRRLTRELAEIGNVLCLEDPIPHWMTQDYADLRLTSPVPIVRHVALPYAVLGNRIQDVIHAIISRGVDGFNVNGGLADFQRVDHIASVAGLPMFHGSEVDLGILEAAYVHSCAAAASCIWPSDIFGRLIRSHDLLAEPLTFDPPHVLLPTGLGLGVDLDVDALSRYRISEREFTA